MSWLPRLRLQRARVSWLIQTELTAARQSQGCPKAPVLFLDFRGLNRLPLEPPNGRPQVVTHQIENCPEELVGCVTLNKVLASRVDRDLSGRKRKDEPPIARVDARKPKHLAKETSVDVGILAVEQEVSTGDRRDILGNAA